MHGCGTPALFFYISFLSLYAIDAAPKQTTPTESLSPTFDSSPSGCGSGGSAGSTNGYSTSPVVTTTKKPKKHGSRKRRAADSSTAASPCSTTDGTRSSENTQAGSGSSGSGSPGSGGTRSGTAESMGSSSPGSTATTNTDWGFNDPESMESTTKKANTSITTTKAPAATTAKAAPITGPLLSVSFLGFSILFLF
uniref:Uncharacterized protein n=1 Tax=Plectus sambesii TaxID=2011161 RepID=A0A914WS40_9BILA